VSNEDTPLDVGEAVRLWSAHSGVDADEMTINCGRVQQGGCPYAAMAWLYLPSLWSDHDVDRLGLGLAAALRDVLQVESAEIQVIVSILGSGSVIEAGQILRWGADERL